MEVRPRVWHQMSENPQAPGFVLLRHLSPWAVCHPDSSPRWGTLQARTWAGGPGSVRTEQEGALG